MILRRFISTTPIRLKKGKVSKPFSLKGHDNGQKSCPKPEITPNPARTRFAPSPTGFIHIGSLRTALYNYLLAKSTGGQFLLRLEDTDQKRLVKGAEENIYNSLKWAGLNWDEGPLVGGEYGPYRQSERSHIYEQYVKQLLDSGDAYRCFCSKDRLDSLSSSARKLYPPSLASYDRKCTHLSKEESDSKAENRDTNPFIIRFKSPQTYPEFEDLLHGRISSQTQVNYSDIRYDDPVLVKSDGLPTYHFANVIDDHLMKITHVIRGEEWIPSTPKHIALYDAFGWDKPKFVHIPLLTSLSDKKLSKRSGDVGILSMGERGILPEALINFVALFGWSPVRDTVGVKISEVFTLEDLVKEFSLDGLTKGNAKVDEKKLMYFNNHFFRKRLMNDKEFEKIANECYERQIKRVNEKIDNIKLNDIPSSLIHDYEYTKQILKAFGTNNLSSVQDFVDRSEYFYLPPWENELAKKLLVEIKNDESSKQICSKFIQLVDSSPTTPNIDEITSQWPKKKAFTVLRYILAGGIPGISIPNIMTILPHHVIKSRAIKTLENL